MLITQKTYISASKDAAGIDKTLATFTPLLKPKTQNPKALILVLFIKDIEDLWTYDMLPGDLTRAARYLPRPESMMPRDADLLRNARSSSFFRNTNKLFDVYKKSMGFNSLTAKYGVKMRGNHTIVAHWPFRPANNTPQAVFTILEASGAHGCERYIEWEWA